MFGVQKGKSLFTRALGTYFITDRARVGRGGLLSAVVRAVEAGVDMIQIREKDLPGRELEEIVGKAVALAKRGGETRILVNDRLDVALSCGAAGVHLPASGLPVGAARRTSPPGFLIGASTHTRDEAGAAAAGGADFVVFGPVFETESKPGSQPVGIESLTNVVREIPVPVFALGGVTSERIGELAASGAAGVAGISAFSWEEPLRKLMRAVRQGRGS